MNRDRIVRWCALMLLGASACQLVLGDEDRQLAPDADRGGCPPDMVEVVPTGGAAFCIDAYEASHDADNPALPRSVAGATPWTGVDHGEALAACAAVGKRLCEADEVVATCAGPAPGTRYPYGDAYQPQACNGWDHGAGGPVMTGSMAGCEGHAAGVFDLQGNVEEWLLDCGHDGSPFLCGPEMYLCCKVLPGSYKSPAYELDCQTTDFSFLPEQAPAERGFRCCRAR